MNRIFETVGKGFPTVTTGKTFFVSDVTGAFWNDLNLSYPPDSDGVTRVHTTVTLALAQCVAGRGDVIQMAPDFTTALTAAEILSAETNGVAVYQAGKNISGVWFAERATASLPQSTQGSIFTVTGKVKMLDIVGEVTTAIQNQACNLHVGFQNDGTNNSAAASLTSLALCAATSIASDSIGTLFSITGTFANGLVTTHTAAVAQAAPTLLRKGTIRIVTSAANTGSVKWRVAYVPLEPGARIFAA